VVVSLCAVEEKEIHIVMRINSRYSILIDVIVIFSEGRRQEEQGRLTTKTNSIRTKG
jgi:hypothetical protein